MSANSAPIPTSMLEGSDRSSSSQAPKGAPRSAERRSAPRTDVTGLWCDRGQVVDLSDRGMRLLSQRRWTEGQILNVTISNPNHSTTIPARCVWCRQEGLFSHAIGLAFDELGDEKALALRAMASDHASTPNDPS